MEARLLWQQETGFICEWLRHGRFDSEVSDLDRLESGDGRLENCSRLPSEASRLWYERRPYKTRVQ